MLLRLLLVLTLLAAADGQAHDIVIAEVRFSPPRRQGYYFHETTSSNYICRAQGCDHYAHGRVQSRTAVCRIWYTADLRNMGCGNSEPYVSEITCACVGAPARPSPPPAGQARGRGGGCAGRRGRLADR